MCEEPLQVDYFGQTEMTVEIVKVSEISAQYKLPDWLCEENLFAVINDNVNVKGHLLLDWNKAWSNGDVLGELGFSAQIDGKATGEIDGLVITGDLHVNGSIINASGSSGPTLIVLGNTSARSLVAGGSFISLRQDGRFSEVVYGHYNDGELEIHGKVTVPIYVQDDHFMSVGMNTARVTGDFSPSDYAVAIRFNVREESPWSDEEDERDVPVPGSMIELLSPRFTKWSELLPALIRGESVLCAPKSN
jgi:hypothetical protein